ncbi:hypothetical protein FHS31_000952 [Sphingomonas vulcanisoli]|uniref:Ice-binding protein C-terminal domain-containing protein n=1 Tax=Sphingomonas vulcanisoli TaxID=1658060 RepID=A0ABX0TPK8_9SPHN|nr:PEPxxWA-CTERM sorting domain-containing protein [Sphingomonas vulcanisoli]NIJ07356.1 hypothetical protein [Sphingomonas vulcanisoli]
MGVRFLKKFVGLRLGVGLMLGATQANALTYTVNTANIGSAGSLNGTVHADATSTKSALTEDAAIGRILLTGTTSSGQSFSYDSFCVDLYDWLNAPATFTGDTLSSLGLSTTQNTQLTNLLANIDSYITTGSNSGVASSSTGSAAERSAAAQLAVWEIVAETTNVYSVDGTTSGKGSFYVSNVSNVDNISATSLADAAQLLSNVKSGYWTNSSGVQVALVRSTGNQTQVVYGANAANVLSAIPEPASWGMMVLGFGVLGTALRRTKRDFSHAIA